HADIVALALHAINATPRTSKSDPFGTACADATDRLIGACGQSLSHRAIDVVGDPRDTSDFRILVQVVLREVVLLAQSRESLCAFLFMRARNGTRLCPCG